MVYEWSTDSGICKALCMKGYHRRFKSTILNMLMGGIGLIILSQAFWESLHVYVEPRQMQGEYEHDVQVGGMVSVNSLSKTQQGTWFNLEDKESSIRVFYDGTLPALVRESHAALVLGRYDGKVLYAKRVYAKHDEYYRDSQ